VAGRQLTPGTKISTFSPRDCTQMSRTVSPSRSNSSRGPFFITEMCGGPTCVAIQCQWKNLNCVRMPTIPRDLKARLNLSASPSLISNDTEGDCPSGTLSGRDWIVGADEVRTTTLMNDALSVAENLRPHIWSNDTRKDSYPSSCEGLVSLHDGTNPISSP
jgi:hypothetical protein